MISDTPACKWLLDVNFLVALAWGDHEHHERCQGWLKAHPGEVICTCPITEMGFVRVSMRPRKSGGRVASSNDALRWLAVLSRMENHQFLPDSLSWRELEALQGPLYGYSQVTNAYLLGLARANRARLVTLDRAMATLQGAAGVVECLG